VDTGLSKVSSSGPIGRRQEHAYVATLVIAYVAAYLWSCPIQDTARDIHIGYLIATAKMFPLTGPILGSSIHLGPIWYYLIAVPILLFRSWLAVAIFVGVVASLKFPLAYFCGNKLLGHSFGLAWAAALGVTSWTAFEKLVFFNPNWTEACLLAALAAAIALWQGPNRSWLALTLGFLLAVSVHAHPTAALPAAVLFLVLTTRMVAAKSSLVTFGALLTGAILPLFPYFLSARIEGFGDVGAGKDYLQQQATPSNLLNSLAVLRGDLLAGPRTVFHAFPALGLPPYLGELAVFGIYVCAICGLLILKERRQRIMALTVALALAAMYAWVAWLRPTTPVYFVYVIQPFVACLIALGIVTVCRRFASVIGLHSFVALCLALELLSTIGIAAAVETGEGLIPSSVLDIKEMKPAQFFRDVWLGSLHQDKLGTFLCGQAEGALHGQLAYLADRNVDDAVLLKCGRTSGAMLGGDDERRHHWLGLTDRFWDSIGESPAQRIGPLGLAPAQHVASAGIGIAIADGVHYFPRARSPGGLVELPMAIQAPASSAIIVSNMLHGYEAVEVLDMRANGIPAAPLVSDDVSKAYRVSPGQRTKPVNWTFRISTTNRSAVDVVVVDSRYPAPP
jgi:hypothetical protein